MNYPAEDMEVDTFEMKEDTNYFESVCQDFVESLDTKGFGTAPTKLRANSVLRERKTRNLKAKNPNCARWCKPGQIEPTYTKVAGQKLEP